MVYKMSQSVIFYHDGILPINFPSDEYMPDMKGYYFWCTNWKEYIGPFPTEEVCEEKLNNHLENMK